MYLVFVGCAAAPVERSLAGPAHVLDAAGRDVGAAIDQLVPIDYFRTDQVEATAGDAASQLRLLDRFAADDVREVASAVAAIERDLTENASELGRLHHAEASRRGGDAP